MLIDEITDRLSMGMRQSLWGRVLNLNHVDSTFAENQMLSSFLFSLNTTLYASRYRSSILLSDSCCLSYLYSLTVSKLNESMFNPHTNLLPYVRTELTLADTIFVTGENAVHIQNSHLFALMQEAHENDNWQPLKNEFFLERDNHLDDLKLELKSAFKWSHFFDQKWIAMSEILLETEKSSTYESDFSEVLRIFCTRVDKIGQSWGNDNARDLGSQLLSAEFDFDQECANFFQGESFDASLIIGGV